MVNLVITETEPKLNGYYRNRTVFSYKTVFTEVLKPYLPYNHINRTELTILTERAAILTGRPILRKLAGVFLGEDIRLHSRPTINYQA